MRVAVSLTAADPLRVGEAAGRAVAAGADAFHVDFGDGAFVPWLGGGIDLVHALARLGQAPVDVHLMVAEPEPYIAPLAAAGADSVFVHVEAARYPWRLHALATRLGLRLGIALNPATPVGALEPLAGSIDLVTLLSTEPDGAGELMLPGTAGRVASARALLGPSVELEVDGGVTLDNFGLLVERGAGRLVVGRAVLEAEDATAVISRLRSAAIGAVG